MVAGLIAVPFFYLHNFLIRFLLAVLKVKEANITRVLHSLLYLVMVMVILWAFRGGTLEAVISYTVAFILASLISFYTFTREFRPMKRFNLPMTGSFLNYGIRIYIILIFNFLNYKLDILLVKYFLTASDVSYYQIAVSIAQRFWYLPNALGALLFPTLMAMKRGSSGFTSKVCRNNLFLMIPLSIIAVFIARPVIVLLYGSEYEAVTYAMYSILWGITIFPIYKFTAVYFASEKKLGIGIFASSVGVAVNIVANIFLIPRFGIVGAGVATSISYSVLSIILLLFFRAHTGIGFREILVPTRDDLKGYARGARKVYDRVRRRSGKDGSNEPDDSDGAE